MALFIACPYADGLVYFENTMVRAKAPGTDYDFRLRNCLDVAKPVGDDAKPADHHGLGAITPVFDNLKDGFMPFAAAPPSMDQQQEAVPQNPA